MKHVNFTSSTILLIKRVIAYAKYYEYSLSHIVLQTIWEQTWERYRVIKGNESRKGEGVQLIQLTYLVNWMDDRIPNPWLE